MARRPPLHPGNVKNLTETVDKMNVIPGYWDPRQLRFILREEEGAVDIQRLVVVVPSASSGASGSDASSASAASEKKSA